MCYTAAMNEPDLEQRAAAAGLKMTKPRRAILAVLRAATDHPSADQVFERARAMEPAVALGTVYRNLAALEAADIVVRHEFGEGYARYEIATHRHGHLIDRANGSVVEFSDEELEGALQEIAQAKGYHLTDYHLKLWGDREE